MLFTENIQNKNSLTMLHVLYYNIYPNEEIQGEANVRFYNRTRQLLGQAAQHG